MSSTPRKKAPGEAGRVSVVQDLWPELEHLRTTGVAELRGYWTRRFRKPPPPIQSADILYRLIAWRLQVERYGDLDAETRQTLSRLARKGSATGTSSLTPMSTLRPGSVLVREWRGESHRVLVLDKAFEHEGTRYKSLTQIARHITGTRWSGPRFFGLDQAAGPGARPVTKSLRST